MKIETSRIRYDSQGNIRTFEDPTEAMPFPVILAIDPSMNNLGFACYNANLGQNRYDIHSEAWRYGLINPRKKEQFKWWDAHAQLIECLDTWRPTHLACEWPEYFDSEKGRIAASMGYTIDLAGLTGYLVGRFNLPMDFVILWKPQQWKGMVPKHVTHQKFLRLFGQDAGIVARNYSHDVIDAIMIAEFWLTLYHREKFSWIKRWKLTGVNR